MTQRRFRLNVSRIAVTLGATACFAAAFALVPSTVRSQLAPAQGAVAIPAPSVEPPLLPIAPVADPFVPRLAFADEHERAPAPPLRLPRAPKVQPAIRVSAIATGARPSAIVEIGSSVEAVGTGDVVDGALVTSITPEALELSDGRRFLLVPARPAP